MWIHLILRPTDNRPVQHPDMAARGRIAPDSTSWFHGLPLNGRRIFTKTGSTAVSLAAQTEKHFPLLWTGH